MNVMLINTVSYARGSVKASFSRAVISDMHTQHEQMRRVVSHLASLDHPWLCPHGRPTMKYVLHGVVYSCLCLSFLIGVCVFSSP